MVHQHGTAAHELLSGAQDPQPDVRTARSRLISTCGGVGIVFLSLCILGTHTAVGGLNYMWLCGNSFFGSDRSEIEQGRRCLASSTSGYLLAPLAALLLVGIAGLCLMLFSGRLRLGIGLSIFFGILALVAYILLDPTEPNLPHAI